MTTYSAFDTHKYIKRLKLAGFSEEQAEAQVDAQAEALSSLITDKLATKDDLIRVEGLLKEDIIRVESSLRKDMVHLESSLKQDIANLAHEAKQESSRLDGRINEVRAEFRGKFHLLYWMIGFVLASSTTGTATALYRLFSPA